MKKILILLFGTIASLASAQSFLQRGEVRSETTLGLGQSSLFDSYLSPLPYSGLSATLSYQRYYIPSFMPEQWSMEHTFNASGAMAYNSPMSNMYLQGLLNYDFGMYYRLFRWNKLEGHVGGVLGLYVGGITSSSSGNNPANLSLGLDVGIGYKLYYPLSLGKQRFELRYEGSVPVVGTFFSPRFMESYYSMFMVSGYADNFAFAHPGTRLSINQAFTVGWKLSKYTIKLGWAHQYRHTNEWALTSERNSNYITVGVSRRFSYK